MKTIRKSDKAHKATPKWFVAAAVIFLATVLVYLPAFDGQWIWDDDISVFHNPVVTNDDGLYRIWLTTEDIDFWPMTKTVFWIEYQIFRNKDVPAEKDEDLQRGCHVVNIALHALASVLIYLALRRLKIPGALLAGLVFALHPVNVSSVAWVSETKNTLSMVFLAGTVLCYLYFEQCRRWLWYAIALLGFALALTSKTSVIMLPVGLLGLAWWQRGRIGRRDVLLAVPFFLLSAGMGAMTVFAQGRNLDALSNPLDGIYRLAGAGWAVWFYIYKAVVPVNLSMTYPHWKDTIQSLGWISFLPTAALLALFVVLLLKRRTWWAKPVLFAMGYVVLAALPVLGFFDMTFMMHSLVADHFQYVPIVGVISLLCAAGWKLAKRGKPNFRIIFGLVAVGVLVGLASLTWKRSEVLKTEQSLWQDTVSKNPEAWMAQYKLGGIIALRAEKLLKDDEALRQEAQGLLNQAKAFDAQGNQRQADTYRRLARTKNSRADAKLQQVRVISLEAEPHCRKAVELQPMRADNFSNLGLVLVHLGRIDEGIQQYHKGIKADEHFDPNKRSVSLLMNFGLALLKKNQLAEAAAAFKQAYLMQPEYQPAFKHAWFILVQLKKYDEVVELLTLHLKAHPEDTGAHHDLAVFLFETGKTEQAMVSLKRSLDLNPANPLAHMTQGDILLATGRPGQAVESYRKAIQLNSQHRILNENRLRMKLADAQSRTGSGQQN